MSFLVPKLKKHKTKSEEVDEYGALRDREEQEAVLLALIDHRSKQVDDLRQRLAYYQTQLEEAERRLEDSQIKLARVRSQENIISSNKSVGDGMKDVKVMRRSISPTQASKSSSQNQLHFRPQLVIPAVNAKTSQPMKMEDSSPEVSTVSGSRPSTPVPTHINSNVKLTRKESHKISFEKETVDIQAKGKNVKFDQKEHKDLIRSIPSCTSPCTVNCQTGCFISSQHKRRLRSLVLCPTNDQLFVTSALDGVVNLWEVQDQGSSANLVSSTNCVSLKKRWPEDIAWHPHANRLFSVYSADGGDSQIAVLDLNETKERTHVSFLNDKPHVKGIINNIEFMPWNDTCFVTGGSDHAVILWNEDNEENLWDPRILHKSMHSSAVMGVAGMQQKQVVISAGADKRIIGFDLLAGRADFKHQIESKCTGILPNPCDFNLFMVQSRIPEKQLRLFDMRLRQPEIHSVGWKQESSESQSALINQAWSPDGLYITSGSADPMIHIFDIRFNGHEPSQSIRAHQRRVFKAEWHHSLPLLISISSDLNIGLHKIT